jgi:hypothetical protein
MCLIISRWPVILARTEVNLFVRYISGGVFIDHLRSIFFGQAITIVEIMKIILFRVRSSQFTIAHESLIVSIVTEHVLSRIFR